MKLSGNNKMRENDDINEGKCKNIYKNNVIISSINKFTEFYMR